MIAKNDKLIDRLWQLAYCCAYRLMKVYWALTKPKTHGALIALWHDQKILLIQNSYQHLYTLPGGYVRRGESALQAAKRELLEEVGLSVTAGQLMPVVDVVHSWEHKRDHVEIFQVDVADPPQSKVDHREVVGARLYSPQEALKLELFPPLKAYLEQNTNYVKKGVQSDIVADDCSKSFG